MSLAVWIIIIVVAILLLVAILRAFSPRPKGEYRKQQPGLSFGRLDRALQSDKVHRESGEFTIAMDLGEIDMMIQNEDYDLAEEKVRELLKDAEERQDTLQIANMMGYLEKIELAKKRRF
jgi:flagellar biosynthesis/type III secretory pathway M-ring protein FliF/YscJ